MQLPDVRTARFRAAINVLLLPFTLLLLSASTQIASAQDHLRAFRFVENIGQWDNSTLFQGSAGGALVRFQKDGIDWWYRVRRNGGEETTGETADLFLRTEFLNSSSRKRVEGEVAGGALYNYYYGTNSSDQFVGAHDFRQIRYRDLYHKIDALYREDQGRIKYDLIVSPGGNPSDIEIHYDGADDLLLGQDGSLKVTTRYGTVREAPPYTYQIVNGRKVTVESSFELRGDCSYGFRLGAYDPNFEVVIDPCLAIEYLTFFGGGGFDEVTSMATDSTGHSYAVGFTTAANFPTFPQQPGLQPDNRLFISKISPDGTSLLYSSLFGPEYSGPYEVNRDPQTGMVISQFYEALGEDVEVTADGRAVVGMTTVSRSLTTTPGAYQATHASNRGSSKCVSVPADENTDLYLFRLTPSGTVEWATYLGGNDEDYLRDFALDGAGNVAITGLTYARECGSGDTLTFPVTIPKDQMSSTGPLRSFETFVCRLDANGQQLPFSAYYGGSGAEFPTRIAVGPDDTYYILGSTNSTNLKTTAGAYRMTPEPGLSSSVFDLYLARIDPGAGTLLYSTYINDNGGAGRRGLGFGRYTSRFASNIPGTQSLPLFGMNFEGRYQDLLVESDGVVIIGGSTRSTTMPTTGGAFQGGPGNPDGTDSTGVDAFVMRFDMPGNRIANATYLGGNAFEGFGGLAFDGDGNIVVGLATTSENYPVTIFNVQDRLIGKADAALTVLNRNLGGPEYSTYLGGAASSGARLFEQSVTGVTADGKGGIYIYGGTVSFDLPVTPNALQRSNDYHSGWIAKLSNSNQASIGAPLSIDFPQESCDQLRTISRLIFNGGGAPLQIDSIRFARGKVFRLVNPPSFPLTLGSCDSISLQIAFDPLADTTLPCGVVTRDTVILYSSNAIIKVVRTPMTGLKNCVYFELRDHLIQDARYSLGSMKGYNLIAFVRGDDQRVTVTPDPANSGIVLRQPWQNVPVVPGVISFDFDVVAPDTGSYCSTFYVTIQPCDRRDTIRICTRVTSGFFNISPDTINLGLVECARTPIPTKIWNSGNDTLKFRLSDVNGRSPFDIRYDISWDSVKVLAPNDTFNFITYYFPRGVGSRESIPVYTTSYLPSPTFRQYITAELDTVRYRFTLRDLEGAYNDLVELPVEMELLRPGRAPSTELTFLIGFNPNLLELDSVLFDGTLASGWQVDQSRLTEEGRVVTIRMGANGAPLTTDGVLANLRLRVLRGDSIATPFRFRFEEISSLCLEAETDSSRAFRLSAECLAFERLIFSGNRMLKPFYPNPARDRLTLPYRVPVAGRAVISLYDVTGKVVAILLDQEMDEGNYVDEISTRSIPPGIYYCRMVVNDLLTDTREVIIAE